MNALLEIDKMVKSMQKHASAPANPPAKDYEGIGLAIANTKSYPLSWRRLAMVDPEAAGIVASIGGVPNKRTSPYGSPEWKFTRHVASRQSPIQNPRPSWRLESETRTPAPSLAAARRPVASPVGKTSTMLMNMSRHEKDVYGRLLAQMNKDRRYMYDLDKERKAASLAMNLGKYYKRDASGRYMLADKSQADNVRAIRDRILGRSSSMG